MRVYRTVEFTLGPPDDDLGLRRVVERFPFVPADPDRLAQDCYEAYNIQVDGLAQRLRAHPHREGRDRRLRRARLDPRADRRRAGDRSARSAAHQHPRLHDAGLRHRRRDQVQRLGADDARSASPRARDRHPAGGAADAGGSRSPVRARRGGLRRHLRERAGRVCAPTTCSGWPTSSAAIVLGTGDLSELALGWCTYGVGDQMSHYNVNGGVPKTLIQHLIRWVERAGRSSTARRRQRAAVDRRTPRSRPS